LDSAIERSVANHLKRDIRITVVDAVGSSAPGNHREDDDPETIHQTSLEK